MTAATFLPNGHAPQPGEVFANPKLAATLEPIGKGGRDAFYKGPIARAIVADMKKRDGLLDERDFADHKADWVEPISTTYRGYDVYEMPPNTQGFVVLEMLNILEGFDLKALGHNSAGVPARARRSQAHRVRRSRRLPRPIRHSVPPAVLKTLISKDYAAPRRKEIDPQHAAESYKAGVDRAASTSSGARSPRAIRTSPARDRGDTIYMTAADGKGNFISLIQSLFSDFGSGIVAGDTGILLHNRGSGFNLDARPSRTRSRRTSGRCTR